MRIDHVKFGAITIDGKIYPQVLIIGGKIYPRDEEKIRTAFGDTHHITDDEKEKLFSNQPKIILIGNGFDGLFETSQDFISHCQNQNINLIILHTPLAVDKFNELQSQNKNFNALLHLTC